MKIPNGDPAAQEWVLAEYRRRRHAHRPWSAMQAIADQSAVSYMFGVRLGMAPTEESQLRDQQRFEVADWYAHEIWDRGHHVAARVADRRAAFWVCGRLHATRVPRKVAS